MDKDLENVRKSVKQLSIRSGKSTESLEEAEEDYLASIDCSSLDLSSTNMQIDLLKIQLNELQKVIDRTADKALQMKLTKFQKKISKTSSTVMPQLEKAFDDGKKCCRDIVSVTGANSKKRSSSKLIRQFSELPTVADRMEGAVGKLTSHIPGVISRLNSINKAKRDLKAYLNTVEQDYVKELGAISKDITRVHDEGCSKNT